MNHEGRSLKNPQPQDIKLKIGNAKKLENLLSCVGLKLYVRKYQYIYLLYFSADFGFARFLQDGVMAATLCGSPMYMVTMFLYLFL